jgi:hypothetical protein
MNMVLLSSNTVDAAISPTHGSRYSKKPHVHFSKNVTWATTSRVLEYKKIPSSYFVRCPVRCGKNASHIERVFNCICRTLGC